MSTIFDVARRANVSITTVSRALNGYSDVSETTRKRIIEAARALDYYPSATARNLQGRRTDTIALAPLINEHIESEPFFTEVLGLLALSAFHHNLSLLVTVADALSSREIYRELAGSNRVDGVILADIKPQDERIPLLSKLNLPFVAFGRTADYESLDYPFVDVDNESGMRRVVEYLVSKGHRRIAYVSGPLNTSYSLHRYSGYRKGLEHGGLPLEERLVIADLQVQDDTVKAVARLISTQPDEPPETPGRHGMEERVAISAIVAANDNLALQVVRALQERGIEVGSTPGCIAVSGFDDLPFAEHVHPPLTTVRQPLAAIADLLLDMLVLVINSKTASRKKTRTAGKATQMTSQNQPAVRSRHVPRGENGQTEPYEDGHGEAEAKAHVMEHSSPQIKLMGPTHALVVPELVVRASA